MAKMNNGGDLILHEIRSILQILVLFLTIIAGVSSNPTVWGLSLIIAVGLFAFATKLQPGTPFGEVMKQKIA